MSEQNHEKHSSNEKRKVSKLNQDIVKKCVDLFDRLPIGIYRSSPEGEILTANPAFISLLGYNNFEDLEGIDLNKTHKHPEGRKQFIKEVEEKGEIYAKESVLVDSNGNEIYVEEYSRVYRGVSGEHLFYEGVVIDINEKVKNRQRIEFLNGLKELIFNTITSFINVRLGDIDYKITYSLGKISEFIGADRSYIFLFDDEDMNFMSNTHEALAEGISSVIDDLQDIRTSDYPWWMDNLKKNKAIVIRNVKDLPVEAQREKKVFTKQHIKSLCSVPLFFDFRLIGFLGFDMVGSHKTFDDDILELLDIAASQYSNILNYYKSERELIEHHKQLHKLVDEKTAEIVKANEQLKIIAENSSDVIWTTDMDLNFIYISPSIYNFLGYTTEEYSALPFDKRLPQESSKKLKDVYLEEVELINSGKKKFDEKSKSLEIQYLSKSGERIWGEVSFGFTFDTNGKPTGVHGIARNINERKQAEVIYKQYSDRFKVLVENTSDWIWELDTNGVFTYTNPVCESMTGYTVDEIIGKPFTFILDPSCCEDNLKFFQSSILLKKPFQNHENIAVHKNGRKINLQISFVPIFDDNDEFIGLRGITRDITEKKSFESILLQSYQKVSQHLRNTLLGHIEWDNNLEVLEWNNAAQTIFGYNKSDALFENMIEKLIPKESRKEILEIFLAAVHDQKPTSTITKCMTKDKNLIQCEWFNTPITDEADNITGMASLVRKI